MRDAFVSRLLQHARVDSRVMLITGDLGFGVLDAYAAELPCQFLNAGVAEQNMIGLAVGLALDGRIVVTYSIGNFGTLRCLEQIRNGACYHEANVKVVAVGGGFSYGSLGVSHHATEDLGIMRALPGMTVVAPACDWEAAEAATAMLDWPGAFYVRLERVSGAAALGPQDDFALGRARTLRAGEDLTLIGIGGIVSEVLAAADELAAVGINVRVLSMHTLKPIDRQALMLACSETGGIVTVEEHSVDGGLGGAVAEVCLESGYVPRAFRRIGLRSGFASVVGEQAYLRALYGLDARAIASAAADIVRRPDWRVELHQYDGAASAVASS